MLIREQLEKIGQFIATYQKEIDDNLIPAENTAQRTELNNVLDRLHSNADMSMEKEEDFEQSIKDYYTLMNYLLQLNLDKAEAYHPDAAKEMRDIVEEVSAFYEKLSSTPYMEGNRISEMIEKSKENYEYKRFRKGLQTTLKENNFFTFSDIPNDILKSDKSIWGKPSKQWTDMETTFNELRVLAPEVELQFSEGSPEKIQEAMEEYKKKLEETIEKAKGYTEYKTEQLEKKNKKPKDNERLRIATAKKIQVYAELKLDELAAYKERTREQLGKTKIAVVAEREAKKTMEGLKDLDSTTRAPHMEEQSYFTKMQDNLKVLQDVEKRRNATTKYDGYFKDSSNMKDLFTQLVSGRANLLHVQKTLIYGLSGLSSDDIVVNDCLNFIIKGESSNSLNVLDEKLEGQLDNIIPEERKEYRLPALERLQNVAFENLAKVMSAKDSLDADYYGTTVRLNDFFFSEEGDLSNGANALSVENQRVYSGITCVGAIAKRGIEAWDYITNPGASEKHAEDFKEYLAEYLTMRIVEAECKHFKALGTGEVNPIFKDLGTGDAEENIEKLNEAVKNTTVFKRLSSLGEVDLSRIMNSKNPMIDEVLTETVFSIVGKDYFKESIEAKKPEKVGGLAEAEKETTINAPPEEENAEMDMGM